MLKRRMREVLALAVPLCAGALFLSSQNRPGPSDDLERGFRNPPQAARPHVYWLWLNGYVHPESAREELDAMKDAGFSGVLLFDMGARGEKSMQPPAGPAFLSAPWMKQLETSVKQAKQLGMQVDLSVISSWDLGGHWIEPRHASMGLYSTEAAVDGGKVIDVVLPFPPASPNAPKGPDGKPAFWLDAAVIAVRDAQRRAGHEIVFRLVPDQQQNLREAVLDNGNPGARTAPASMTPAREFSVGVSNSGIRDSDFKEVARGMLKVEAGPQRFAFPAGTTGRHVRLQLLSGHDAAKQRWTLGGFQVLNDAGVNVAAGRASNRAPGDADISGWRGVFATTGAPPFVLGKDTEILEVTKYVDRNGRLQWNAPPGRWSILRYVCMNTGERLKVPSPASDGWATDHLNPEATRAHMDYVIDRLKETFGDLRTSGLKNLYLASYEVRGLLWTPGFIKEFERRRGYDMTRFLPAIFGATVGDEDTTARFLFDYRKTLGELLIDAYYVAAREAAHKAGLTIKSEAGGPGPPAHNVPVDALLANSAVDDIQGEFWPYRPDADTMWVVKETASAGHIYGKPVVHMESFTSSEGWREGPQDLKPSADRVFTEGCNHIVWHTWAHVSPEAGKPGWVYSAGTHINRNVTWWPKVRPFVDYLSRSSYMLQRGRFVGDVLYYYGDGGYKFVGPRRNEPSLGPGYDYDYVNSDVILHRLSVRDGRLTLPDGTSYSILVLPEDQDARPEVLAKIEQLVAAGATVVGPKPLRASGLEGFPASNAKVRELAARLWGDLDGRTKKKRAHGKGSLVWGILLREVLASAGIQPDFIAPEGIDFTHRREGGTDIYFVRNMRAESADLKAVFRVSDREPEFWDPRTGGIQSVVVHRRNERGTEVPLKLAPNGSVFVVFRRPPRADAISSISPDAVVAMRNGMAVLEASRDGTYQVQRANGSQQTVQVAGLPPAIPLSGPWAVEFEKGRGAPERIAMDALKSWTENENPGVKYFAGAARYQKAFSVPRGWLKDGQRAYLDLGNLWTIGEVWVNGKPLGVVWTAPFEVDCTEALREGANELVVEVINTWFNRLAGDANLPPEKRITRTNFAGSGGVPWAKLEPLRSGLFGPVRVVPVATKELRK